MSMKQSLNSISFNITDGIGHIELIRPPANLMTSEFFTEFNDLVDDLRASKGLNAIIISSRGRHFSTGADLEELLEMVASEGEKTDKVKENDLMTISERNYRSFLFFEQTEIPVIAAIRGVCLGSAFELALFCHFRFCAEDAIFGLPEATYNLIPGLGGIRETVSLCGQAKTLELILRGNTFGAEEALQNHLVDRIVPKRKVVEFSMGFARKIMKNYKKQKVSLYLQQIALNDPFFN
jgi:enoyl-CoA hydratase/carnithine racemase